MAQRVQIILEDDYDGGTADETVSFALDGTEYEIDLCDTHRTAFQQAVGGFRDAARALPVPRQRAGRAARR